jgi:hypothetical protein
VRWCHAASAGPFRYRDGDDLFTYGGKQAGRFQSYEVCGKDGRYLGEVLSGRLITNRSKTSWRQSAFAAVQRGGYAKYADYGVRDVRRAPGLPGVRRVLR